MSATYLSWTLFVASAAVQSPIATNVQSIRMDDGVAIAVECAGRGDTLLIVHGGAGDRTRWTPMFPLLAPHLRVCAMDRRGHGESGDAAAYSLQREVHDVQEVAKALPSPVTVLGHSYGGVAALDAALRTHAIKRLILYEPPLQDGDHSAATAEIERLLAAHQAEAATQTFLIKVVRISPDEVHQMQSRPSWQDLVSSMGTAVRQDRALATYRWDPARYRRLRVPTLLLTGEKTQSPQLKIAIADLQRALPHATAVVLQGQHHNAMDTGREQLARAIELFLRKSR